VEHDPVPPRRHPRLWAPGAEDGGLPPASTAARGRDATRARASTGVTAIRLRFTAALVLACLALMAALAALDALF
jgi:hypothetical protein